MKNLIFIALILFTVFNSLLANTTPQNPIIQCYANEKSIMLNLTWFMSDAEVIQITDNKGDIIFTDQIEKSRQRIKYNLQQLPNDTYRIKIEGERLVQYHQIIVSDDIISLQESKSYYRPSIRNLNQTILVDNLSTSEESIGLTIYNEKGESIYMLNERNLGEYQKVFNLKALNPGKYRVIVSTEHFSDEFTVSL